MRNLSKSLVAIVCAFTLLGAGCAGAPKEDPTANQKDAGTVVSSFLKAVQEKDKEEAKGYLATDSDIAKEFDEAWEEIGSLTLKSYSVEGVEGTEVRVKLEIEEDGQTESDTETFEVVQKDNLWWIVKI